MADLDLRQTTSPLGGKASSHFKMRSYFALAPGDPMSHPMKTILAIEEVLYLNLTEQTESELTKAYQGLCRDPRIEIHTTWNDCALAIWQAACCLVAELVMD